MLGNFQFERTRTAPTGYEKVRLLFHTIRTGQLLAALIDGCILSYFIWWLIHDHWSTPFVFVILTTVSFLTVVFLTTTIVFHMMTGLSPRLNLLLNSILLVLWSIGFGLLSYWMSGTLKHHCDVLSWHDETGIMVCRIYKTLFTFSLLGFISTIAATTLDVHIHRLSTRFGRHMRLDNLDQKPLAPTSRGPYSDADHRDMHDADLEGRPSEAFDMPSGGYGAQNGVAYDQAFIRDKSQAAAKGYALPEGQFGYDTGYHGGHEERAFSNL